jgi:hypothetical protein
VQITQQAGKASALLPNTHTHTHTHARAHTNTRTHLFFLALLTVLTLLIALFVVSFSFVGPSCGIVAVEPLLKSLEVLLPLKLFSLCISRVGHNHVYTVYIRFFGRETTKYMAIYGAYIYG